MAVSAATFQDILYILLHMWPAGYCILNTTDGIGTKLAAHITSRSVFACSCTLQMQKTNAELLHISLVMLVTAIFYLWFAWDAIVFENAFELAACGVLGLAVCARIIYFVVSMHAFAR